MKKLDAFRWLCAATLGALMLLTAQTAAGHGTGGGHGSSSGSGAGSGHGTGSGHGSSSGSGTSSGHGTGTGHAAATGHAKGGHQALFTHRSSQETGDMRFVHGDRFFHQHPRFSTGFVGFRFPYLWSDYGPVYDYRFWQDLAMKVQSELARLGYYRGAIDGVIGSGSRQAIRGFQEAEGYL
ncbi:MAG: peptidoglycan-binding domain-containing protein [Chthoniobacterales bacterium]